MTQLITNGRCVPYDPDLIELAKDLRKRMTPQEQKLWEFLRIQNPRFHRQKPLVDYIVDFYCPAKKLVIEIDGDQHNDIGARVYDEDRTKVLSGFGIVVIRFSNKDIDKHFQEVCCKILEVAGNISIPINTSEWRS